MHKAIYIIVLVVMASCNSKSTTSKNNNAQEQSIADSLAVLNDPKSNLNIQTTTFSEIDSSGVLLFPLRMGESEREGGSLSYKEIEYNHYWNIVFWNSHNKEYHLLSNKKMLIKSYDLNSIDEFAKNHVNYIYYSIITEDYNKDNNLNEKDPTYLYVSDKQGNHFTQISPSNCDLQSWNYIKSTNKLILTLMKDSNKNLKFEADDEVVTYAVDIDAGESPQEIFSVDFKNQLKVLFDKDWKRLKK